MALDLCKYYKKQRFVSYNNGQTWQPLDEYERGELYEAHSSSCGASIFQYRWVLVDGSYICDGKDRYTREVYQYSEDGTVWYNVFPTQYRKATLVERNSPFCDNAGNGQYISGDTDPTSGDTTDCPIGYFWNGTECECNGPVDGNGVCHPCANGKKWNPLTQECECEPTNCNGLVDENCVCHPCEKNYTWNSTTQECECNGNLKSNGDCVYCGGGYQWNPSTETCVCTGNIARNGNCVHCRIYQTWNGYECVFDAYRNTIFDPLKVIKCSESNGILTQNDVGYYESGWTLTSYEIGDCIYRIDDNAFNGQVYLSSVTVSNTVREIGNLAFANCQNLKTISFPNNITYMGSNVFKDCDLLENVLFVGTIPSYLPSYTFENCISLANASWLPLSAVVQIGNYAFKNCINLENISFPSTLVTIGKESFYGCTKIVNILIPENVEFIGDSAFMACDSLTNVTINSNNIELGTQAFASCVNLTAVTFNSSAITIGNDVFGDCERLLKLTFTSPTPFEIGEGYFDNTNECAIFVPCQSEQAYKTAWPQYADRISCNDTGVYYRWVDDPSGIYCDGTDQYTRQKQQSTTNGITWTDTGVYRPITLITHYSPNCGYIGDVALTVTNEDGYTRYYEPCE